MLGLAPVAAAVTAMIPPRSAAPAGIPLPPGEEPVSWCQSQGTEVDWGTGPDQTVWAFYQPHEERVIYVFEPVSLRDRVRRKLAERRIADRRVVPYPAPRYDEVFTKGTEWLAGREG